MAEPDQIDEHNHAAYSAEDTVNWYDQLDALLPSEKIILEGIMPAIRGKKILDIGVGGGRTTKHLLEISRDYTGIDYSQKFAELVKKKFRLDSVYCCDARDMSRFADGSFDFVLFSFNSIDYIPHEGRLKAMAEIRRVLRPSGIFMFSTHNRNWIHTGKTAWQRPWKFSPGFVKDCLKTILLTSRRMKMKKLEVREKEYAIINDDAHNYALLTYHITIPEQVNQLKKAGFGEIKAYNMKGERVEDDANDNWTYFTAVRASSAE
ncbi:MAG: type 11 methyltransferase [Bacteroidetes bacterium]|nr:MAG: type 11 methyltransferase [Bacteroidota bacterium]